MISTTIDFDCLQLISKIIIETFNSNGTNKHDNWHINRYFCCCCCLFSLENKTKACILYCNGKHIQIQPPVYIGLECECISFNLFFFAFNYFLVINSLRNKCKYSMNFFHFFSGHILPNCMICNRKLLILILLYIHMKNGKQKKKKKKEQQ